MLEKWLKIKKALNEKGIKVLPIKSFLLPSRQVDEIDCLVVNKKNYHKAEKILEELGFERGRTFYRDRQKRLWSFPSADGAIHLHAICGWAGIEYLDPEKLWKRRRKRHFKGQEITVPSFEDELLISALHSVFENKAIKKDEFLYLQKLVEEKELNWDYIKETCKSIGCEQAFDHFWGTFEKAKESSEVQYPVEIPYGGVVKAMLEKTIHDFKNFQFYLFFKDIFSYLFDIALDFLKG